jgi:multidrug efflux pump subunit AcrB
MLSYCGLILATVALFWVTPTGFIPAQDQSYLITVVQLPPGASLSRTDAVLQDVSRRLLAIEGVRGTIMLPGYDAASNTNSPNSATAFIPLVRGARPFRELHSGRGAQGHRGYRRRARHGHPPPLIDGIGSAGGYRMMVQDRSGHGYQELGGEAGS